MQVIIKLKSKQVGGQDTRQATLELISANVFSNYGVVVLLTDLNEYWHFLWLTKETRIEDVIWRALQQQQLQQSQYASGKSNARETLKTSATPEG